MGLESVEESGQTTFYNYLKNGKKIVATQMVMLVRNQEALEDIVGRMEAIHLVDNIRKHIKPPPEQLQAYAVYAEFKGDAKNTAHLFNAEYLASNANSAEGCRRQLRRAVNHFLQDELSSITNDSIGVTSYVNDDPIFSTVPLPHHRVTGVGEVPQRRQYSAPFAETLIVTAHIRDYNRPGKPKDRGQRVVLVTKKPLIICAEFERDNIMIEHVLSEAAIHIEEIAEENNLEPNEIQPLFVQHLYFPRNQSIETMWKRLNKPLKICLGIYKRSRHFDHDIDYFIGDQATLHTQESGKPTLVLEAKGDSFEKSFYTE